MAQTVRASLVCQKAIGPLQRRHEMALPAEKSMGRTLVAPVGRSRLNLIAAVQRVQPDERSSSPQTKHRAMILRWSCGAGQRFRMFTSSMQVLLTTAEVVVVSMPPRFGQRMIPLHCFLVQPTLSLPRHGFALAVAP